MYGRLTLIQIFLAEYEERATKATFKLYRAAMADAARSIPSLGSHPEMVGPYAIEVWLKTSPTKPSTKVHYRAVISSYYRWCIERGYAEENPVLVANIFSEDDDRIRRAWNRKR